MTRHLIQILLPTHTRGGGAVAAEQFARVRVEMTERFGGVTAYSRSPATGLWINEDETIERDQVIMVEVVVDDFDREWWAAYRKELEARFDQEEVHVRALALELI
jgi:hypothetical protein